MIEIRGTGMGRVLKVAALTVALSVAHAQAAADVIKVYDPFDGSPRQDLWSVDLRGGSFEKSDGLVIKPSSDGLSYPLLILAPGKLPADKDWSLRLQMRLTNIGYKGISLGLRYSTEDWSNTTWLHADANIQARFHQFDWDNVNQAGFHNPTQWHDVELRKQDGHFFLLVDGNAVLNGEVWCKAPFEKLDRTSRRARRTSFRSRSCCVHANRGWLLCN